MITGLAMKYPEWYPFFDQAGTRLLHFQAASWFAFVFGVQLVTGLIMYLVPVIIKYQQKKRMASQTSGQE